MTRELELFVLTCLTTPVLPLVLVDYSHLANKKMKLAKVPTSYAQRYLRMNRIVPIEVRR